MTAICDTLEPLLSLYATGGLEGEEALRLSSHLEGCAACRAQMEQTRDLLDTGAFAADVAGRGSGPG